MINDQEYIISNLMKKLHEILPISEKKLKNICAMILGLSLSCSVILSQISQKLGDYFSVATEASKIKRLERFLRSTNIDPKYLFHLFVNDILKNYIRRNNTNTIEVIVDHSSIDERFLVLQFSMKIGRRSIPIYYKIFDYNEKKRYEIKHVKEGLKEISLLFKDFSDVKLVLLADRWFLGIELIEYIESLGMYYCIRSTNDVLVQIDDKKEIPLKNIQAYKNIARKFKNVFITKQKYKCNLVVCKEEGCKEIWYLVTNLDTNRAIIEYKKRFDIEEMFLDMKSNGFNIEKGFTESKIYFENLYMCVSMAYIWMVILGADCSKNKKSKIISATKRFHGRLIRIYSLFKSGLAWFNRCCYESRKKYKLKFDFKLYEI